MKKLNLDTLKVNSFITSLNQQEKITVDGGTIIEIITLIICGPHFPGGPEQVGSISKDIICPTKAGLPCPPAPKPQLPRFIDSVDVPCMRPCTRGAGQVPQSCPGW